MKRQLYFIIFALLTLLLILARIIYVQVLIEGSGYTVTMSPVESQKEGWFIRNLTMQPNEVPINDNYNVIIQKAWLEHDVKVVNRLLWIERKPSNERMILKVVYSIKNKLTGQVQENNSDVDVYLSHLNDEYPDTLVHDNSLSKVITGTPDQVIKLIISDGVTKGVLVTFN